MNLTKEQFLDNFQKELSSKITGTQNWWTKSLFHFTDIKNAISIIEKGVILSRNKAIEYGLMTNDNANDDVISRTSNTYKDFARLYFGPTTPTQKNNEGIKPKDEINNNAHCPIPIMFVFDFKKVFLLENVKFTDGNLAKYPNVYENIFDLTRLNFNLIYHRSWFYPEDRDVIINARHSEVIVKDKLELENNLQLIIVRSIAEKEYLLHTLSFYARQKYQNKIFVQPTTGIFTNDWLYVNSVSIIANQINIEWHLCSSYICLNKYKLFIEIKYLDGSNQKYLFNEQWYPSTNPQIINLPQEYIFVDFEISINLDDICVYKNIKNTLEQLYV